jgi:hypothetical protein
MALAAIKLWLDDGSNHQATVRNATAQPQTQLRSAALQPTAYSLEVRCTVACRLELSCAVAQSLEVCCTVAYSLEASCVVACSLELCLGVCCAVASSLELLEGPLAFSLLVASPALKSKVMVCP